MTQMIRAVESICPRSTPWRAAVGSAWCRLCHDSPMDRNASHHTLPDLSRLLNGLEPTAWQMELIDQVVWCSSETRTRLPQKKAVRAPCQVPLQAKPTSGGMSRLTAVSDRNELLTRTMSRSASRSGANRSWLVCSMSNSQPMCACQRPLVRALASLPYRHGECGSPSLSLKA